MKTNKTIKEIAQYNKAAWDRQVDNGNPWTIPVSSEDIKKARKEDFEILLTAEIPVPSNWFPPLKACRE